MGVGGPEAWMAAGVACATIYMSGVAGSLTDTLCWLTDASRLLQQDGTEKGVSCGVQGPHG